MDKSTRDLIHEEVNRQIQLLRGELPCDRNHEAISQLQHLLELYSGRHDSGRDLMAIKLDNFAQALERLFKQFEGNGKGSMSTRLALLEQEIANLITTLRAHAEEHRTAEGGRGRTVKEILVQCIPVLLSWVGFGIIWLLYLMIKSGMQVPVP